MRFGPWLPLEQAQGAAPAGPGVVQARADALLELPAGKSAMVLYAASAARESLRDYLGGRGGPVLATAAAAGARWVRFAETMDPERQLARLLRQFEERFGAPPAANRGQP